MEEELAPPRFKKLGSVMELKRLHVSIPHGRHGARVQPSSVEILKQEVGRLFQESNVGEHHVISRP